MKLKNKYGSALLLLLPVLLVAFPVPVTNELYREIDRLAVSGNYKEFFIWPKPFEADSLFALSQKYKQCVGGNDSLRLERIELLLTPFLSKTDTLQQRLVLSAEIQSDMSTDFSGDSFFVRGIAGAAYSFGRFRLVNRVSADAADFDERYDHVERMYKGSVAADMPEAYLQYTGRHFSLMAGRNRFCFGKGRSGALLLGSHGPSMNGVMTTASIGFLRGDAIAAAMDPLDGIDRWFSAMRIAVNVTQELSLAFSQSVVYAGKNRKWEPGYVIPAFLYYFTQFRALQGNELDNLFLGMEAEYRFKWGRLYGELLADDFQVDRDSVSSSTQNAIAFLIGFSLSETNIRPSIAAEYLRINSYVYKHMGGVSTHYLMNRQGGTLGHPLGPDADALYLYLDKKCSGGFDLHADFTFARLGSLNDPAGLWDAYGKADETVPVPPVEKRLQIVAGAGKLLWNRLRIDCGIGTALVMAPSMPNEYSPVFKIQSSLELYKIFNFEPRAALLK